MYVCVCVCKCAGCLCGVIVILHVTHCNEFVVQEMDFKVIVIVGYLSLICMGQQDKAVKIFKI